MPRYLIVRFSSIGDIVLTSPVIRCLKQQIPDAEIHYLTKPAFREVVEPNPYIDRVWLWDDNTSLLLKELGKQQFDFIIDLHHNLRSLKVKLALRVQSASFRKLNIEKYLYVNFNINRLPHLHIVDRYIETVKDLGVKNDLQGLDYFLPEGLSDLWPALPDTHREGYIAIVGGALKQTKRLPEDMLAELCRLIPYPLILLGGKAEAEEGKRIAAHAPGKIFNACGKFSLGESAWFIKNARAVASHDTGLMHIAAAFRKPIVSIWGNTIPQFGMYPYLPKDPENSYLAEVDNLSCRPCSKIGYSECPKKHFRCMRNQNLKKIADQLGLFWGLGAG